MKCGEGQRHPFAACHPTETTTGNLIVTFIAWRVIHTHDHVNALCPFSCCRVFSVLLTDTCLLTTSVGRQRHCQAPPLCTDPWCKLHVTVLSLIRKF